MNIDKLHIIHDKQEQQKISVYRDILNKCYRNITNMARNGHKVCWYFVPFIIFGKPIYNVNACICFIIVKLKKKGFDIKYYQPNILHISWEKKKNQEYDKYLLENTVGYAVNIRNI